MKLGKLKEVNIRKVWGHEQYGFSKWLSNEENINELGEILTLSDSSLFVIDFSCIPVDWYLTVVFTQLPPL